jgi:hypothetical protein
VNGYENTFKTKDFYLACYLKATGIKLIRVNKEAHVAYFCFEASQEIKKIITGFYNSADMVSAGKLINAIKDLKSLIYNI